MASLLLFLLATGTEIYNSPSALTIEPPATERSAEDSLIVPGTRIGPVTLGLAKEQFTSSLGLGKMRPHEDGVIHLYEDQGLAIYTQSERVVSVTVRSPNFRTRGGVGVGVDVNTVLQNLGKDYELVGDENNYALHNWQQGWHVGIEDNTVVYFQITTMVDSPPVEKS